MIEAGNRSLHFKKFAIYYRMTGGISGNMIGQENKIVRSHSKDPITPTFEKGISSIFKLFLVSAIVI